MPLYGDEKVLDIGSGTGLLSLIAAQLGAKNVTAVELEDTAYAESQTNFSNSPWSDRLAAVHSDIQSFAKTCSNKFDLIISNPPFFDQHSRASSQSRNTARHTDTLSYSDLIDAAVTLSIPDTRFYFLLPIHVIPQFIAIAAEAGLHLINRVDYRGYQRNIPKVSALTFNQTPEHFVSRLLTIYQSERTYSPESENFLSNFLLRFSDNKST